jgi:hypothetical protein
MKLVSFFLYPRKLYAPRRLRHLLETVSKFAIIKTMSQLVHGHLRKVQAFLGHPSDNTNNAPLRPTDSGSTEKVRRMFRVLLKNPWDNYTYIRHLSQTILIYVERKICIKEFNLIVIFLISLRVPKYHVTTPVFCQPVTSSSLY